MERYEMAKPSVMIKKTDLTKDEASIVGTFNMDDNGRVNLETPDYGEVGLEPIVAELDLLGKTVEIKVTAKNENAEVIDYLDI